LVLQVGAEPRGRFGAGIIAGEPSGLAAKFWVSNRSGIDAAVGWSFFEDERIQAHLDYQFHLFAAVSRGYLSFFFGGGIVGRAWDGDAKGGVRLPVGGFYRFGLVPLGIFVEVAPRVEFIPEDAWGLSAVAGAYYFFGGTQQQRDAEGEEMRW